MLLLLLIHYCVCMCMSCTTATFTSCNNVGALSTSQAVPKTRVAIKVLANTYNETTHTNTHTGIRTLIHTYIYNHTYTHRCSPKYYSCTAIQSAIALVATAKQTLESLFFSKILSAGDYQNCSLAHGTCTYVCICMHV